MIRVLVANEDIEQNSCCCQFLSNDKNLSIDSTFTGLSTINNYFETKPDVLVLDSNISDIHYTQIINKLSVEIKEKQNINTIVTISDFEQKNYLEDVAKVYKIFYKPLDYKKLLETINLIKYETSIPELTISELDYLLMRLNFSVFSNGTYFIKSAILQCYYYPDYLKSLDNILNLIAYQYNVTTKTVREGIRSALIPLNNRITYNKSEPLLKIFDSSRNITPKYFLETIVTYLRFKKTKSKKNEL